MKVQIFTYNIYETGASDDRGWFEEPKCIRGRSTHAIVARIAAEARATSTQVHPLHYRIWLEGELVAQGSFGVRRRFRDGNRVEAAKGSGKIERVEKERALVTWDDGASGWHALDELRPFGRK